ncbi:MAG: hypothetical protein CME71_09445 [Halobacteriovorax sp.]|nr:hypothetical protein [Halobacteriovorax sp.]
MLFYAVVSPGLEKLACEELLEKFPTLSVLKKHGGLEIDCSLEQGLALNHSLKIPTRILLRVLHGKVRDLPKLYKKIKNFDWRAYLVESPDLDHIVVSAHESRLFDERKIKKTVIDAISDSFKAVQPKKVDVQRVAPFLQKSAPSVYLRFKNDELTISLDTSGERLDRRGTRTWVGLAPLRETFAHACLRALLKEVEGDFTLCDPMCGSGVFPIEALEWNQLSRARAFAYQAFPCAKDIELAADQDSPVKNVLAIESDAKTFEALSHNLPTGVQTLKANALEQAVLAKDLVMIANPPYGVRLKLDNPTAFLNHVVEKLMSYQPRALALLIPKDIKINRRYKNLLEFSNGGIAVKLVLFKS